MGQYNILGYSARGRMPLNHALRPGQFQGRLGSVNIWAGYGGGTTVNNYYMDDGSYYGYEDTGMSGIMKWAMGSTIVGGVLGAIGKIITALGGGGGSKNVEGKGSSEPDSSEAKDLKELRKMYKDYCTISDRMSDGSYIVTPKGGKPERVENMAALKEYLNNLVNSKQKTPDTPTVTTTVTPSEKQTEEQAFKDLQSTFPGLTSDMLSAKGITFKDGAYYDKDGNKLSEDQVYEAITGNKPVAKGFDLKNIDGNLIGVYDDGKNAKGKDIGDFNNAKLLSYDANTQTATIGNHKYKVVSQDEKYMYLEDINPTGGSQKNRQVYTLEKNGNIYELHQRDLMGNKNPGLGRAAHHK